MRVVAVAGGTGSAKLLRGLARVSPDLAVVANPGDNVWIHGLYICPDLDIAMYALAGIASRERGWGIEGDTFRTLEQLAALGEPSWFRLGDRDLASHIVRTEMLRRGATLTEVTRHLCGRLGVKQKILPATDSPMETHILTPSGDLHLQDFWVHGRGRAAVKGVKYVGAEGAQPTREVRRAIAAADRIVICPANPVTSIGPILAIPGMKKLLAGSRARRVALSPMIGRAPFSGPAGELLRAVGARPDSVGVARLYWGVVTDFFIHRKDAEMKEEVESLGMKCRLTETVMKDERDEIRLAREVLAT